MTKEKTEARYRCVFDQSVYNTVSQAGDQLVGNIVALLRQHWAPAWAPVDEVVTAESVAESAKRLEQRGLVDVDGELVAILVRDPMTRRGRLVDVDYEKAELRTGAV